MDRYTSYEDLDSLKPNPKNMKGHDIPGIGDSVEEHGLVAFPIIDERTGLLIAGHGRRELLLAMKEKGAPPPDGVRKEGGRWLVPVGRGWSSRDDDEADKYLIRDNALVLAGGWKQGLGALLQDMAARKIDISRLGLRKLDLDAVLAGMAGGGAPDLGGAGGSLTLQERFLIPPFSVLDARQGYWQDRKRAWLALGIKSEVGRGDNLLKMSETVLEPDPEKRAARRLGTNRSPQAASFGQDIMRGKGEIPADGLGPGVRKPTSTRNNLGALGAPAHPYDSGGEGGDVSSGGTSIFDPVLCELLYRWFVPPGGAVLDPFAGGSVRGVVAARLGLAYTGIDLRPEQIAANEAQAAEICRRGKQPRWIEGDSQKARQLARGEYDFIFSCPPYVDLERYSDDPRDLSTMEFEAFVESYRRIIAESVRMLRGDRFAAFVVGDVRAPDGSYRDFPGETIRAFRAAGAELYNEAVLIISVGSLPIRVGKQFVTSRKLGKTHQNCYVFCKGDPRKATAACGTIEVAFPAED